MLRPTPVERWSDPQGSRLFSHGGPLSENGFVNMVAEKVENLCFGLSRKAGGQLKKVQAAISARRNNGASEPLTYIDGASK